VGAEVPGLLIDVAPSGATQSGGQFGARAEREATGNLPSGRGRNLGQLIEAELTPLLRGWMNYFRLAEVKGIFDELDSWIRRKLLCLIWRQWKRTQARAKGLMKRGLKEVQAWGIGDEWPSGVSLHFAFLNQIQIAL
jgi:hypothetical protein